MLSFGRGLEDEFIKPGSLVSGIVESVSPQTIVVALHDSSYTKGTISLEHLADHHGRVEFFVVSELTTIFCFSR